KQGYVEAGNVRSPYGVETIFCWKQIDPTGIASGDPKRKRFCNCNSA
ncbi:GNAT family acetyltransferase, partial [Janthinobacterium lividum]